MKYLCPVCGFHLDEEPADFNICESCGTEFGYHDSSRSHSQLRYEWLLGGMKWSSQAIAKPLNWNPTRQMIDAGFLWQTVYGASWIDAIEIEGLSSLTSLTYNLPVSATSGSLQAA